MRLRGRRATSGVMRGAALAMACVAVRCGGPTTPGPTPAAPAIACPANVTVRGVGSAGQTVTYASPVTTGGAAPVTTTCAPASGAIFAVGTTAVACTARDSIAQQAQCSFSVTLTGLLLSVTKFMAFGDSFTEGQNGRALSLRAGLVDGPNAYPIKLQGLLNAEYPGQGVVVSNHGKGGEFVGDGVGRLRTELPPEHPGALLLLDGYNDLLARCQAPNGASSGCNAAITEVVAKVRECIQFSRSSGVQYTFVSTLTPPGPFAGGVADRRIAPEAIVQANSRLAPMVRAEGAVIVDPYPLFLGHEGEYVDTDGLHLRPAGYQVLAETFFAAIRTTVSTTPAFGR